MQRRSHIIFGKTRSPEKIQLLRKDGEQLIFVVDHTQLSEVKEKDGVVYLSPKTATSFMENHPSTVCHFYAYIPPGCKRKKRRK